MELFDASALYEGFEYPQGLKKIVELDLVYFDWWFIMEAAFANSYARGLALRYPERKLVPFAKREDCDDVACFEAGKPDKVEVIHDFASPGWEQRQEYDDFWSWFLAVIQDMVEREREDEKGEARNER